RHLAHVDLQDLLAAAHVGQRHDHLAVEAAWTQQRRIEHVRTVRRGDHDHAFVALEAVHLDEQLVQRLLALVVTAAEARATMPADRVDLVDEDDARRVLLRLLEHVAHARRTDADEHLDEIRARDREERHLRLAGDRAGEQRLAGARRPDHQHALRNLAAETLELGGILQEVDDLDDLLLGFLDARDVRERDVHLILPEQAGTALAERHRASSADRALHLTLEVHPDADLEQDRERRDEQLQQEGLLLRRARIDDHTVLLQRADERRVVRLGAVRQERALVPGTPSADRLTLERDLGDGAVLDVGQERGIRDRGDTRAARPEALEDRQQHDRDDDPQDDVLRQIVQNVTSQDGTPAYGVPR